MKESPYAVPVHVCCSFTVFFVSMTNPYAVPVAKTTGQGPRQAAVLRLFVLVPALFYEKMAK